MIEIAGGILLALLALVVIAIAIEFFSIIVSLLFLLIVIVAIIAIVSNFFTEVVTIVSVIIFYVLGIYFSNKYLDKISNWKKKFKIQKTFYELEIDKKLVLLLSDSQSQLKRVSQNEFLELLPLSDILKIKSYTLKDFEIQYNQFTKDKLIKEPLTTNFVIIKNKRNKKVFKGIFDKLNGNVVGIVFSKLKDEELKNLAHQLDDLVEVKD